MKQFLLFTFFCVGISAFAQYDDDSAFAVIAGTNQYYANTNFLSSKSKTGFTLGIGDNFSVSDNSFIRAEFTLSRFYMDFLGRETSTSNPQWISFSLDRINFNALYHYNFVSLLKGDIEIGVSAGGSMGMFTDFVLEDDYREDYLLDPYGADPEALKIDGNRNSLSFNFFGVAGIGARYRKFELNVRYHKGLTDVYRSLPAFSEYVTPKGKDDYLTATVNFYLFSY
ncbi:hypothetical protein ACLI1A_02355 [Flavobacterium sp. RHBU_3]|uniref:hypothetical protein n=1 Tax=Flavobacterium sp. RHBU_3 TaxID=3391184 RepID=UPI00398547E3